MVSLSLTNNFIFLSLEVSYLDLVTKSFSFPKDPKSLFLPSLHSLLYESLLRRLLSPVVMMAFQSSLPFACSTIPSVSYSHIRGSIRLASDSDLTDDICL